MSAVAGPAEKSADIDRSRPGPRRRAISTVAGALAVLGAALVLSAPPPSADRITAAPGFEASSHLWGLFAAWSEGQPYQVRTHLLGWPDGVAFVLVDPIHLPAFALGMAAGGPGLAWSLMRLQGLLLGALAGAVLGRELRAPVLLAALAAMAAPPLRAAGLDGISEDLAVGLPALVLGLALRLARRRRRRDALALALALVGSAHAGPYNSLLAALGFGLVLAWGGPPDPAPAAAPAPSRGARRSLLLAALLALPGVLPPMAAVAFGREGDLPGQAARAGIPPFDLGPDRFRGGLMHGVDLLDLVLPLPLTGGQLEVHHTGYLGLVALVAAALALRRRPALWPLLALILGLCLLALGPWLSLGGRPVELLGRGLPGPAGLLMEALPPLGRLQRWYRAAALASILLAPLAASLAASLAPAHRRSAALLLGLGLLLDSALLSPVAWPAPSSELPGRALRAALEEAPPGAVLELPLSTSGSPGPGQWRDIGPLEQLQHGRPLAGSLMGLPVAEGARRAQRLVLDLAREGRLSPRAAESLRASGYALLLLRQDRLRMPPGGEENLQRCLGGAPVPVEGALLFALGRLEERCIDPATPTRGGREEERGNPRRGPGVPAAGP